MDNNSGISNEAIGGGNFNKLKQGFLGNDQP